MDVREIWDGLPFKIRAALLHLERVEQQLHCSQHALFAVVEPPQMPTQMIVIEPIAHRRVS